MKRKIIKLISGAALCIGLAALAANIKPVPISVNAGTLYSGGSGTENDPFLISTPEDWYALGDATQSEDENASQEGLYFELTNDITVTKGLLSATGNYTSTHANKKYFAGTFDGKGNAISLTASGMGNMNGLFPFNSGVIKNLTRDGVSSGGFRQGGIVGENIGTIENCVNNAKIGISGNYAGGIVAVNGANSTGGKIINCINNGYVYSLSNNGYSDSNPNFDPTFAGSNGTSLGGIIGFDYCYEGSQLSGCLNTGTISGLSAFAGIVGTTKNNSTMAITNCKNSGLITPYDVENAPFKYSELSSAHKALVGHIGGIVGMLGSKISANGCVNVGNVTGHGGQTSNYWRGTGGIAGSLYSNSVIENCINLGDVNAALMAGGIAGYGKNGTSNIRNNFAAGNITTTGINAGGIFGIGTTFNVENNISAANVSGSSASGKVRGAGDGTTANNTEYTISDSALEVLREIQLFECEQVQDNSSKQAKYEALNEALNNLTGQDDMEVLNREWKTGTTYMDAATYVRNYCSYNVSTVFGSGLLASSNFDNKMFLILLISVLSTAGIVSILIIKKRKHN